MALDTSLLVVTRSSFTRSPALRRTSIFSSKQTRPTRKRRTPRWPRSAHRSKAFDRRTSQSRNSFFRFGRDPHGFDILPDIPGVDFDAAWERRVEGVIDREKRPQGVFHFRARPHRFKAGRRKATGHCGRCRYSCGRRSGVAANCKGKVRRSRMKVFRSSEIWPENCRIELL
jgi:hypothetical protein